MSDASRSAAALTGLLPAEEVMTRAVFGQFARHVPMWMVVQDAGDAGVTGGLSRRSRAADG